MYLIACDLDQYVYLVASDLDLYVHLTVSYLYLFLIVCEFVSVVFNEYPVRNRRLDSIDLHNFILRSGQYYPHRENA